MDTNISTNEAALRLAAEHLGGQAAVAEACGYADRRNVSPWFQLGRPVPQDKCPLIERATAGAVTCEELRSDLAWHRIADLSWPWHPQGKPLLDVLPNMVAEPIGEAVKA